MAQHNPLGEAVNPNGRRFIGCYFFPPAGVMVARARNTNSVWTPRVISRTLTRPIVCPTVARVLCRSGYPRVPIGQLMRYVLGVRPQHCVHLPYCVFAQDAART